MQEIIQQVRGKIVGLLEGTVSRRGAADWALGRIKDESADYSSDVTLWNALDRLAGADLQSAPGEYLHGEEDFRYWLADFDE